MTSTAQGAHSQNGMKLIPPLVTVIASFALAYWMFSFMACLMGGWTGVFVCGVGLWASMVVCAMTFMGYWWHEPFKGIQINIREPTQTFSKMSYEFDPAHMEGSMGCSAFVMMFYIHFSTIFVKIEMAIHEFMGHNMVRAEEHCDEQGETDIPVGMMAQEMNHGKVTLFYCIGAERGLGYPEGFRMLWKLLVYNCFPKGLQMAFICWIEASFIVQNRIMSLHPKLYDCAFAEGTKWVFAWHMLEETEHCWDSVQDLLETTSLPWRIVIWAVCWILLPVLMITQPLIEGFLYGWKTFKRDPMTLLKSLAFLFAMNVPMLFGLQACSFLHLILEMRPSDYCYEDTYEQWEEKIYEPYAKKHFEIKYRQDPHHHIRRRTTLAKGRSSSSQPESANESMTQNAAEEQAPAIMKAAAYLARHRNELYKKMQAEMKTFGMSEEQINDTEFPRMMQKFLEVDGKKRQ